VTGVRLISCVSVAIFAGTLVWGADSEDLGSLALLTPCDTDALLLAASDDDIVLGEITKDTLSVDGQSVCPSLDTRKCRGACGVNLGPVLVRLGVEDVVLKVNGVLSEDRNGLRGLAGQRYLDIKRATLRGRNVVGNVLCDRVIEVGIPRRVCVLSRVGTRLKDGSACWEVVEVVVLLPSLAVWRLIGICGVMLTGPNVRSKPFVMFGYALVSGGSHDIVPAPAKCLLIKGHDSTGQELGLLSGLRGGSRRSVAVSACAK
jgi:hypothetical protein